MPMRVTSLRGPFPRHCAQATQLWRAVGNTVSDLTSPRFEPKTSCSRDKRVIPLDQLYNFNHCKSFVKGVLNVAYHYTGIISIQYRFVSFETPCKYFLTNLAQKYHEKIG